ncbi:MAG: DUF420 domain-containing protein [Chlorobiota bacterium]|jgi:putative membrane protein|nr:DUF420 domain-containing protein [Chlorobiota bacterium]QQS66006.1 MAG: DUF420 domain-containing protein [Chlorobiota bacterium]
MLPSSISINDKKAKFIIYSLSVIVFLTVALLGRTKINSPFSFDIHLLSTINAIINSSVSLLLVCALISVKKKNYILHKKLMLSCVILSSLFLIFYIMYHLFAIETKYGGEGTMKYIYYFILSTHIILAAIILPFILFTTYRGLTGEYDKHSKLARKTFPIWLYVTISGVVVYLFISPYYS